MTESRKRAVSVRLNAADIRKIKKLAQRLDVRDTDIIRFAIKTMLGRVAPLQDPAVRGSSLIPVFVECGVELLQHFELDTARLERIINDGVTVSQRVDADDIALLAMGNAQQSYAMLKLSALEHEGDQPSGRDLTASLRNYLYQKYVFARRAHGRVESAIAERSDAHD